MTPAEGAGRKVVSRLIALRERNDEVMRELEAQRDRLVAEGGLISSPLWRRLGPKPTRREPASPHHEPSGHRVWHCLGPAG
jgi:hypothetical protein